MALQQGFLGQCQIRLFRWYRVRCGKQGQCGEVVCAHMCACVLGVREMDTQRPKEAETERGDRHDGGRAGVMLGTMPHSFQRAQ